MTCNNKADKNMSGYIGIYNSGLSIIAKSLYISGSKMNVVNLTQSKINECYIVEPIDKEIERKRLFHLDGAWGYLLAFVLIVFFYCVAIICVCLVCPFTDDNIIRRKFRSLRSREFIYDQILLK